MYSKATLPLILLALLATPRTAAGDDRKSAPIAPVVLVSMGGCCPENMWRQAEDKVKREFLTLNIAVQVVNGVAVDETAQRMELEQLAAEKEAVCALRIVKIGQGRAIDLWLNDRVTGKITFRHLSVDGRTDNEAADIAALKVVETLRASLLESRFKKKQPPEVTLPRAMQDLVPATDKEKPLPKKLGLRVGGVVEGSPGDLGAMGAIQVALAWQPLWYLSFDLESAIALFGKTFEKAGLKTTVDMVQLRIFGHYEFIEKGFWRPAMGIGAGVALVFTDGFGEGDQRFVSDQTVVAYVGGSARLGLAFTDHIRLKLGMKAGALLPEVRIFFEGEEVVNLGLPLLEGFLDFEVRFL